MRTVCMYALPLRQIGASSARYGPAWWRGQRVGAGPGQWAACTAPILLPRPRWLVDPSSDPPPFPRSLSLHTRRGRPGEARPGPSPWPARHGERSWAAVWNGELALGAVTPRDVWPGRAGLGAAPTSWSWALITIIKVKEQEGGSSKNFVVAERRGARIFFFL